MKEEKKYTFMDKFFFSPIASLLLIISLILNFFFGEGIFLILAGFSLLWIIFKWIDFKDKHSLKH